MWSPGQRSGNFWRQLDALRLKYNVLIQAAVFVFFNVSGGLEGQFRVPGLLMGGEALRGVVVGCHQLHTDGEQAATLEEKRSIKRKRNLLRPLPWQEVQVLVVEDLLWFPGLFLCPFP